MAFSCMRSRQCSSRGARFDRGSLEGKGYTQGDLLGVGGATAQTYDVTRNRHTFAMKKVAKRRIKEINMEFCVYREKKALSALQCCPFIVRLYDSFKDKHFYHFILEHASRGDFQAFVSEYGALRMDAIQFYTAELIRALEYVRFAGFVHKDIKPENLLLSAEKHLKLCDFGFSVQLGEDAAKERFGTIEYMAPEQFLELEPSFSTDIWALGCLLYEWHMGYELFENKQSWEHQVNLIHYPEREIRDKGYPHIVNLVRCLLIPIASARLGASNMDDLKRHPFYRGINWNNLEYTDPPLIGEGPLPRPPVTPGRSVPVFMRSTPPGLSIKQIFELHATALSHPPENIAMLVNHDAPDPEPQEPEAASENSEPQDVQDVCEDFGSMSFEDPQWDRA